MLSREALAELPLPSMPPGDTCFPTALAFTAMLMGKPPVDPAEVVSALGHYRDGLEQIRAGELWLMQEQGLAVQRVTPVHIGVPDEHFLAAQGLTYQDLIDSVRSKYGDAAAVKELTRAEFENQRSVIRATRDAFRAQAEAGRFSATMLPITAHTLGRMVAEGSRAAAVCTTGWGRIGHAVVVFNAGKDGKVDRFYPLPDSSKLGRIALRWHSFRVSGDTEVIVVREPDDNK